jgi:hypothetical protein
MAAMMRSRSILALPQQSCVLSRGLPENIKRHQAKSVPGRSKRKGVSLRR